MLETVDIFTLHLVEVKLAIVHSAISAHIIVCNHMSQNVSKNVLYMTYISRALVGFEIMEF